MKHPLRVTGEYNRYGYTVLVNDWPAYVAGNNPQDSSAPDPGAGIGLRTLRRYCRRTCQDIAQENHGVFLGIHRVPDVTQE